jgi:hypothetical protein
MGAYGRRKLQTRKRQMNRRNAEEAAEKEAKQARVRAMLPNVLGIASAIGYNENVLRLASSLSRNTRSNYLTTMVREGRVRYGQEQAEREYGYTTPLHNAIRTKNVEKVREMLNTTRVSNRQTLRTRLENQSTLFPFRGETALESALREFAGYVNVPKSIDERIATQNYNQTTLDRLAQEKTQAMENTKKLQEIIGMLLEKNARVRPKAIITIWHMDLDTIELLLKAFPIFQHKSIIYENFVWRTIEDDYKEIDEEIKSEEREWNRHAQNFALAPQSMYDERDELLNKWYAFDSFLHSQDPHTKTFSFTETPQTNQGNTTIEDLANQIVAAQENPPLANGPLANGIY